MKTTYYTTRRRKVETIHCRGDRSFQVRHPLYEARIFATALKADSERFHSLGGHERTSVERIASGRRITPDNRRAVFQLQNQYAHHYDTH